MPRRTGPPSRRLRQPACPDEERAALLERLARLEEAHAEAVRALAARLAPAKIPNLRKGGPEFKLAHAMLLDLLFAQIEAALQPGEEPVPAHVHDATPEARGLEADLQPASYANPDE